MHETVEFRRRLAEVIAWWPVRETRASAAPKPDLQGTFRSPALLPPSEGEYTYIRPAWTREASAAQMVSTVVERRALLLQQRSRYPDDVATDLSGGRLLWYIPTENISDGASALVSGGFFDDWDEPPWDTWLWYHDRHLLCWVPPECVRAAQAGIDVNAVQCIDWATTAEAVLAPLL